MDVTQILFYINLALVLCTIIELTALSVMFKKTAYMYSACLTAIFSLVLGVIAFCVQLPMYLVGQGQKYAMYAVYAAVGVLYAGVATVGVYCILLSGRSNKVLCMLAGIFGFVPPIGMFFTVRLVLRLQSDTRAQNLVYTGYAYTFAALGAYIAKFKHEFVDGAAVEDYPELDKRGIKNHLKELKRKKHTIEGGFDYATALLYYKPQKLKKAFRLIKKAAGCSYAPAVFNLGYCYETGTCVKPNLKKACELYDRAVKLGDKDAELRLACVEFKLDRADKGYAAIEERAKTDIVAKYDLAVAAELGLGTEKNMDKALNGYIECIELSVAQKRLFALAAGLVNTDDPDGIFDKVMALPYSGDLKLMMDGLKLIHDKCAPDAADTFLEAVKLRGKWEGMARCLVGTLYIDNGALDCDRQNGAAYIKSAIEFTPIARDVYKTVPKCLKQPKKKRAEKN